MRQKFAGAAAFTVTALWSVAAWAHSSVPQDAPLTPLASASAVGFVSSYATGGMAALAAAALLFTALRGRKALGTSLVALTLWIGFQAAVHSVHHLGQAVRRDSVRRGVERGACLGGPDGNLRFGLSPPRAHHPRA